MPVKFLMSHTANPTDPKTKTSQWRLWVDRCGGYSMLVGDRFSVGGSRPDLASSELAADVQIRGDLRRFEGILVTSRRGLLLDGK